jgi:hypothetical protein
MNTDTACLVDFQRRLAQLESIVRRLNIARPYEVELHRLRIHLHMVQEEVDRMGRRSDVAPASGQSLLLDHSRLGAHRHDVSDCRLARSE